MTCVTVEMSRPRAATSVATRIGTRPALNEIITPSRAPCDMSPCSALTFMPRARGLEHLHERADLVRRLDLDLELLDVVDRQRRRLDLDRLGLVDVALG